MESHQFCEGLLGAVLRSGEEKALFARRARCVDDLAVESLRVLASAPWPRGSDCVFESATDLRGSLDEIARRGVWWEVGRHYVLPDALPLVCSPELGEEAARIFRARAPS